MSYYPAWLDILAWVLIAGGACFFLLMKAQPEGHLRGLQKVAGCVLASLGALIAGTDGTLFNLRAPEISVHGQISELRQTHGRNASTHLSLDTPSGSLTGLYISDTPNALREGETLDLRYQDGTKTVLYLRILDGEYAGGEGHYSNGLMGSLAALAFGVGLLLYGVFNFLSDGTARVPDSKDNLTAMPDGEVDSQSMLNLSANDQQH